MQFVTSVLTSFSLIHSSKQTPQFGFVQTRAKTLLRICRKFFNSYWLVVLMFVVATSTQASEFYVSPSGSPSGNGSAASPWDLQTALNQPSAVKPGDTIWVRGGVHRLANRPTKFISRLSGVDGQPITVRAYPGERATIDGNLQQTMGGWVNYWGLEIMNSQQFGGGLLPNRNTPQSGPWPTTWWVTYDGKQTDFCVSGFDLQAPHCKLINMVIHDNIGGGIGMDIAAGDAEVYGTLSYYNGWQGPDRAHGHGIYGQNAAPTTKYIIDCLVFDNYALGMQATGTGPTPIADNFDVEGSAFFLNGALAASHQANLLLGAFQGQAQNPVVLTNFIYDTMGSGADFNLGYDGGSLNAICEGNYFQTSTQFGGNVNMMLAGNTFVSGIIGVDRNSYPNNNYLSARPTQNFISVRPNKYEPGRANIIVYNWEKLNSVAVDVSQVLSIGAAYEVRNAQDFYGVPVASGTYQGGAIMLPTMGLSVASPVGANPPAASGPDFNAFVLLPLGSTGSASNSPPAISPIPDQTIIANSQVTTIPFTVSDPDTASGNLIVSASSSNPQLFPNANISIAGSGANRNLMLTPAPGQSGTATITVTVSDGNLSSRNSFTLTTIDTNSSGQKVYLPSLAANATVAAPMRLTADAQSPTVKFASAIVAGQGTVDFTINIPVADNYVVWGKVFSPSYASDSFYVSVDNGLEDIYDDAEGAWSNNWQWTVVNGRGSTGTPGAMSPRLFALSPGRHVIHFRSREVGATLAAILVTNDRDFVPRDLIANDDRLTAAPDITSTFSPIALVGNDADLLDYTLSIANISDTSAQGATVSFANGMLYYTPPPDFTGEDNFVYVATDGAGNYARATVRVNVQPTGSVSLHSDEMQLRFQGIPNVLYEVQVSDDLLTWTTIATLFADENGLLLCNDPDASQQDLRFYRIVQQ
jgi:Cadherin-like domain/Bacterial Ig domain